ncbi:MAG: hypothetical protein HY906_24100 [Deltaproteobacteria bacterium]|nr:hypothetical protein [Deltaproteobacteria bacterium]
MPSMLHEAIVTLFRNRPTMAAELLVGVLHVPVPSAGDVRVYEADLTQIVPTEYRADLVVVHGEGRDGVAVVLEVQLAPDPDKEFVWPLYQAALRARLRLPVCVLVVTDDDAVARWAATPVLVGPPASWFVPVVLGPAAVPWVTAQEAARAPELAVLSALAHGREAGGAQVALAAIAAAVRLDAERARLYHDLVMQHLGEAVRAELEALMATGKYEYQSEFARQYIAEGEAQGELKGKAEALLAVLAARGFPPTDEQRERILSCRDLATLDRWVWRAASAASVDEALG